MNPTPLRGSLVASLLAGLSAGRYARSLWRSKEVRKFVLIILIVALSTALTQAQDKRVNITFAPEKKNRDFDAAAEEYRRIWADEGEHIIRAMEQASRLQFPERNIKAEIYEGPSSSGRRSAPMRLRASYSPDVKKGTLVHELGHRMNSQLKKRPKDLDEHRLLFLYLYDLWENLYGKAFADKEVAFEKTLKGLYDYEAAWNWALAMSQEERFSKFGEVLRANRK